MVQFEFDECIFVKLRGENACPTVQDKHLKAMIRRIVLDIFWGRATETVKSNRRSIDRNIMMSKGLGMKGPYHSQGPLPNFVHCAYEVDIQMVRASLNPGRNDSSHVQYKTISKIRSKYSNWFRSSSEYAHF